MRRCSPHSSEGYSLVELLVGLAVALTVSGAALTLALGTRGLFEIDQGRVRLSQSLRAGKDFLVTDLRQAGERLGNDIFSIELHDGASGGPDELVVRRNLLEVVHPVCADVGGSDDTIKVALENPPPSPSNCEQPPTEELLDAWEDYREAHGTEVPAFIYNPVTGDGQFFIYENEDRRSRWDELEVKTPVAWSVTFPQAQGCRVYILEERRYRLVGDVLQVVINGDTANPVRLVDGIDDFQAQVVSRDGTKSDTLNPGAGDVWFNVWHDLKAIEVTLAASASAGKGKRINRRWSSQIMPRNVLSN